MVKKGRNRAYSNGELVILWQASKCVHATTCFTRLRTVFDPVKRPWINPHGSTTERILEIIELCPSDALTFCWVDEGRNEREASKKIFRGSLDELFGVSSAAEVPNFQEHQATEQTPSSETTVDEPIATITLRPNGPIVVGGSFELINSEGVESEHGRHWSMVSLCRCGHSGNMPHCDGSHFKEGFRTK